MNSKYEFAPNHYCKCIKVCPVLKKLYYCFFFYFNAVLRSIRVTGKYGNQCV